VAKEVISRCDECGTTEDVQEFTITYGGETKDVDLCPEHGGPVLKVFTLGTEVQNSTPKPRKSSRSSHAVVAIEDWQPEER
jgi:hypothetical protein